MKNPTFKSIARNMHFNQYCVFLRPNDVVTVTRNTKGNMLPGFSQEMTVSEALKFNAWSTERGAMTASVVFGDRNQVQELRGRCFYMVDTGDEDCTKAAAAEERETMTTWSFE